MREKGNLPQLLARLWRDIYNGAEKGGIMDKENLYCLVRYDGLGEPRIENTVLANSEDETEKKLGGLPPSEEYVAGRLGGCDVYRSNDYQIVGPFDSIEEAVLYIEC